MLTFAKRSQTTAGPKAKARSRSRRRRGRRRTEGQVGVAPAPVIGSPRGTTPPAAVTISEPSDASEREADRIAYRIAEGAPTAELRNASVEARPSQGSSMALQSSPFGNLLERVRSRGGVPLEPSVRESMEPRFGRSFDDVRIHTGPDATGLAEAVHARAFTLGSDIFVKGGGLSTGSHSGKRLLAHELVHVAQGQQGVIQRAVEPEYAGRCAGMGVSAKAAGLAAHEQIQAKYGELIKEVRLPRGTKTTRYQMPCPPAVTNVGSLDLWRFSGTRGEVGEIKSINAENGFGTGRKDLKHYLLRLRELRDRFRGSGPCRVKKPTAEDKLFDTDRQFGALQSGGAATYSPLSSVVPSEPTSVGAFGANPSKELMHQRNESGVVVYWCRSTRRRRQRRAGDAAAQGALESAAPEQEQRTVGQMQQQQPVEAMRIVALDRDPVFRELIEAAQPATIGSGQFGALAVSDAYFNAIVRPAPPGRIGQLPLPLQQRGFSALAAAGGMATGLALTALVAGGIAIAPAPALVSAAAAAPVVASSTATAGGVTAGAGTILVARGLLSVAANDNARRAAAAVLILALQGISSSAEAAERAVKAVVADNPHVVQIVELSDRPAIGQRLPGGYRIIAVFASMHVR